ncbi:YebC/PmpR family DNA-binding transcriptional regulator [Candidatus Peregrinibacteria bacterium]|nr:YebC/PmpR family DNA-binding transcriptional regulator [Candidatus Peregrinibacteria bacterium]
MSGHSKWHQIQHKKGILDAKRGAKFTKAARVVTVAARKGGGDPATNPSLRTAIEKAKEINMPNANIERAIKNGTGELKEGLIIEEVAYEAYGHNGVALLIHVVTDNKNRAVSEVKNILTKHGGSMGAAGCTAWMFDQKGIIHIDAAGKNVDDLELAAIDSGAEDIKRDGDAVEIYSRPHDVAAVREKLISLGYSATPSEIAYVPKTEVKITDEATARKILKLMDTLEDFEDVTQVASNFDISAEIMEKIS